MGGWGRRIQFAVAGVFVLRVRLEGTDLQASIIKIRERFVSFELCL